MPKIVILGSCRFEPYVVLAEPNKIPGAWNTDEGYKAACEIFYPAMDEADVIIVYAPDGIGKHTQLDIDYARSIGKTVHKLTPLAPMGLNLSRKFLLFVYKEYLDLAKWLEDKHPEVFHEYLDEERLD